MAEKSGTPHEIDDVSARAMAQVVWAYLGIEHPEDLISWFKRLRAEEAGDEWKGEVR